MNLLLVEDDKDMLVFLERALKSEGFVVDTAADGAVGAHKAKTNDYDLIVLDNSLPYKNGREICTELRAAGCASRVLMLSVVSDTDTKVDLLNVGADDYITKPFAFSELVARLRALMRRSEQVDTGILVIDELTLDRGAHAVTLRGKEISLTPKEFELLEYLMKNQGRVVSRMNLLEHVWDVNADPFTNTVETHILNLRKKIKDDNKKLIHTISGIGYKMV